MFLVCFQNVRYQVAGFTRKCYVNIKILITGGEATKNTTNNKTNEKWSNNLIFFIEPCVRPALMGKVQVIGLEDVYG